LVYSIFEIAYKDLNSAVIKLCCLNSPLQCWLIFGSFDCVTVIIIMCEQTDLMQYVLVLSIAMLMEYVKN
jgi:hypothetical protein